MLENKTKLKNGDCVEHGYFGPLYVNGRFRDGSGVVYMGINGIDGISYQFNAGECVRMMSREEFDAAPKKT